MNSTTQEKKNVLNYTYDPPDLSDLGTGYAKFEVIEPGLSYHLVHYTLSCDHPFKSEPSADFNLLIYFYQFTSDKKILFTYEKFY